MTDTNTAQRRQRSKRGRLLRAGCWTLAAVLLLAGIAFVIVTRSWFIIWVLRPQLEAKLGGDVAIGSAAYERGGNLVVRDFSL